MNEVDAASPNTQRKQKRLGPAPIASFDKDVGENGSARMELSENLPTESRLPEIKEQQTPTKFSMSVGAPNTTVCLTTPQTPRIDISRASSSSHHDSRDSSPENVFDQVGMGTLQETGPVGLGFREDGALELRSSTEELYFMEAEKGRTECEKPQPVNVTNARRSPIMFKFDEQQLMLQHQRKDSACSEVASFLCISGRSSRISSVGSQGSAVSRLSAVSGVSRSPSPHKMLLETSFCGPKPLEGNVVPSSIEPMTADNLEKVILARRQDPTQAVLAEGINIDFSTPKKQSKNESAQIANGNMRESGRTSDPSNASKDTTTIKSSSTLAPSSVKGLPSKRSSSGKEKQKVIVGKTSSGTEYTRIKLKPDHQYSDNGLSPNEKVIEESEGQKKPGSLDLSKEAANKKAAPHFSQLVKTTKATPKPTEIMLSASPKPARHAALVRDESRSPSPAANVQISRKNSFCNLFKAKETSGSPDSPIDMTRKKSGGGSITSKDGIEVARSRSRSKSRDRDCNVSQNGTPSKQKSILTLFKPKKNGKSSKTSSPTIDNDSMSNLSVISNVEFRFQAPALAEPKSKNSEKLRYYETPLDGKSIHIPLHTPPDEKDNFKPSTSSTMASIKTTRVEPEPPPLSLAPQNVRVTQTMTKEPTIPPAVVPRRVPGGNNNNQKPNMSGLARNSGIGVAVTEEERSRDSVWSTEVERHSSPDSQETVISSQKNSTDSVALTHSRNFSKHSITGTSESINQSDSYSGQQEAAAAEDVMPPLTAPSTMSAREKRHILFSMKLGSGSQEQMFQTQLSLSKTESQSSQLSEQASISFDSPTNERDPLHRSDTVIKKIDKCDSVPVIIRRKNSDEIKRKGRLDCSASLQDDASSSKNDARERISKEELINTNRHSRYIENVEEIMEAQQKLEILRAKKREAMSRRSTDKSKSSEKDTEEEVEPVVKPPRRDPVLLIPDPPSDRLSMCSTDSGSEQDSHTDSTRVRRHLPRNIGAIEDHESAGLVSLQESFDDELPYVPTTLPEERTMGIKMIPVRERAQIEVKTCPLDRPRSTTPINPASLENYCGSKALADENDSPCPIVRGDKLKISLPRRAPTGEDSKEKINKNKSPRRTSNTSGKNWFEFADQTIGGATNTTTTTTTTTSTTTSESRKSSKADIKDEEDFDLPPPPLPPRKQSQQWIDFDNIPEKRKPPKRITTLPTKDTQDKNVMPHQIQYNYVNPEECQCECHESERGGSGSGKQSSSEHEVELPMDESQPLLEPDLVEGHDRTSMSDSSIECSFDPEQLQNEAAFLDPNIVKPFGMDLSVGQGCSNRSSVLSQEPQSPDSPSGVRYKGKFS